MSQLKIRDQNNPNTWYSISTGVVNVPVGGTTGQVLTKSSNTDYDMEWSAPANRKAGMVVDSVSGTIASFTPDATIDNLLDLTIDIEPVQAGSGDPSPDNVRSISGQTAINIWVQPTYDTTATPTAVIQLGQTVYGGTLNVTSGTMTVDRRYIVADGVNVKTSTGYGAGGPNWLPAINLSTNNYVAVAYDADTVLSNYLKYSQSGVQSTQNTIAWGNSGHVLVLHIGTMQGTDGTHGYSSANEVHAAVNTYLQEHPLQICYKLATPMEIQLSPVAISTISGQTNNVWADTGDVSVQYAIDVNSKITAATNALPRLVSQTVTGNVSTTAYKNWYYKDFTDFDYPVNNLVCAVIDNAKDNSPAFTQIVSNGAGLRTTVRVYCSMSGANIRVVLWYLV